MKEINCEEWDNNPRKMWVWNNEDASDKIVRKGVHILNNEPYNFTILTVDEKNEHYYSYKHCAEIIESRRMTEKEFSRWLRENPTREYKIISGTYISSQFSYSEKDANKPIDERVVVRENDGEWRKPLIEVE